MGDRPVRWPRLGRRDDSGPGVRPVERLAEDLRPAGLDVEHGVRRREPSGQHPGVAPRRPFLGGAAVEPREPPPVDGRGRGLGEQGVELGGGHRGSLAQPARGRPGAPVPSELGPGAT